MPPKKRVAPDFLASAVVKQPKKLSNNALLQTIVTLASKPSHQIDRGEMRTVYQLTNADIKHLDKDVKELYVKERLVEMARQCRYMGNKPSNYEDYIIPEFLRTIEVHNILPGAPAQPKHADNLDNPNYYTAILNTANNQMPYGTEFDDMAMSSHGGWNTSTSDNIIFSGSAIHRGPHATAAREFVALVFTDQEDPNTSKP